MMQSRHLFHSSIRYLSLIITLLIFLFSFGCTEDPASPADDGVKPEGTVTIGSEGGIVEEGDLKIKIPAGAFNENHEISISEVEDDGAFGENSVTPSYKISGIPINYSLPLKIVAKYSGALSGESYLGFGRKTFDEFAENSTIVYELQTASDSSGYLISSIPLNEPTSSLQKLLEESDSDIFANFGTAYITSSTQHFTIRVPLKTNPLDATKLGIIFENAFTINHEGLQMPLLDEERIINVVYSYIDAYQILSYDRKSKITNYNIPVKVLQNGEFNKLMIAAQQYLFLRSCDQNYHWVTFAITYWLKDLVSDDPDYQYPSETFLENALEPFNGFGFKNSEKIKDHAIGISGVIKYLTSLENFGLKSIGNLYKNNAGDDKAKVLLNNSGSQISQWWPDFFKQYVSNELFEFPGDYFISRADAKWDINSVEDVSKTFTSAEVGTYQDLSAKLFKINLNYADIDETQNMLFSMKGPVTEFGLSLVIFGIQNGNTFHLGTVDAQDFEIENLKDYYDNNMRQFLVCLVNSTITSDDYLGQSEIDLEIKFTPKDSGGGTKLKYNHCFIEVYLVADIFDTRLAEEYEHYESPIRLGTENEYDPEIRSIEGSFSGNIFTGSFDSGTGQSSTATVILNETHDMILEYSWAEVDNSLANVAFNGSRSVNGVSGVNIPINRNEEGLFELRGSNACSGVSTLLSFTEWENERFGTVYKDSSSVEGFKCDDNSRVVIQFYEQ